ncbi:Ig-like domain-containing protein [Aeromonas veronii]|uniref:Ig-like domain-containing protein n=1 Tax=Aeromonas veronii TaxID=654 RepID=UPI002417771A|nr:Ig-like domain-containing protein [Aeromonas veronii]WFO49867.1 Ig-like domain-containing protein [Aeromonas veronii]
MMIFYGLVRMKIKEILIILFTTILTACGGATSGGSDEGKEPSVERPELHKIDIIPSPVLTRGISTLSLAKGNSQPFIAIGHHTDGSALDISDSVTWSLSDKSLATISGDGLLNGVSAGTITVTATKDNITSNQVEVTITDAVITALQVTPAAISVVTGQEQQLTVMASYSDSTSFDVTSTVAWAVDSTIATVNANGLLTGASAGSTTLTATKDGIRSNEVSVTVSNAVITSLIVTPANVSVAKGQQKQLRVMATYSNNTSSDVTDSATWVSADATVATVTANGLLTGASPGSTTVTATKGGVTSDQVAVDVPNAVITEITVSPTTFSIHKGEHQQLTVMATYSDSTSSDITSTVTWDVDNIAIATVAPDGLLTGASEGSTIVTATKDGRTSTATANVTAAVITELRVTPETVDIPVGQTAQMQAWAIYSDLTTSDVTNSATWSSSDPSVVTATKGLVTGVRAGSSTVNAIYDGISSKQPAQVTIRPPANVVTWGIGEAGDSSVADSSAVAHLLTDVKAITAGQSAYAALKGDGTVVTWGDPNYGGDSSSVAGQLVDVKAVFTNGAAFAALKNDGTVVSWGTIISTDVASQLTGVIDVISNSYAFAALKNDGTVVTWGNPQFGGDSSAIAEMLTNVNTVVSTDMAFAALKNDGTAVSWGKIFASGSTETDVKALFSNRLTFVGLKHDGSWFGWGNYSDGADASRPTILVGNQLRKLAASYDAYSAIKNDGTVVTWGAAYSGEVEHLLVGVEAIYTTKFAFAALKDDGTVVTWERGSNNNSNGGDSSGVSHLLTNVQTISSNEAAFAALKNDGTVVTWGKAWYGGDSGAIQDKLTNVKHIYSNNYSFAALKNDGSVVTWGGWGGDSSAVAAQLVNVQTIFGNRGLFAALVNESE